MPVLMVVHGVQLNMQIVFICLVLMDEILILIISNFLIWKVCSPRLLFYFTLNLLTKHCGRVRSPVLC